MNSVRRIGKSAVVTSQMFLLVLANALPARAENWVRSGQHVQLGLDACVDRDSIRRAAEGFTHYRSRLCHWKGEAAVNATRQLAVRCSEIMAGNLTVHSYDEGKWRAAA